MTGKDYLDYVRDTADDLRELKGRIDRLRCGSWQLSTDVHGKGGLHDKVGNQAAAIVDQEAVLAKQRAQYELVIAQAFQVINAIGQGKGQRYAACIEMWCIYQLEKKQIAAELECSVTWVDSIYNEAVRYIDSHDLLAELDII